MSQSAADMWSRFLATDAGWVAAGSDHDTWQFGYGLDQGNRLVELVLQGTKRATAGALWAYEHDGDRIPEPGDYSVVTDGSGEARCVIRTTEVAIIPFNSVDDAFAHAEGEGDRSLKYWRSVHWDYFTRELGSMGLEAKDDMPVVCERFELVFHGG